MNANFRQDLETLAGAGGKVYPVRREEMPDGGLLAAYYRW